MANALDPHEGSDGLPLGSILAWVTCLDGKLRQKAKPALVPLQDRMVWGDELQKPFKGVRLWNEAARLLDQSL